MAKLRKILKYTGIAPAILITLDLIILLLCPYGLIDSHKDISVQDAAIVLYNGHPREEKSLNNESLRRLNYAVNLFRDKKIDNILFSGGLRPKLLDINGARLMALNAEKMGVPPENIFSEIKSYDTLTNIRESLKIAEDNNWRNLAVVSSKFHLVRTKYLVNRFIGKENINRELTFLPYGYSQSMPPAGRWALIRDANYNFASFALVFFLPDKTYRRFVKRLRTGTR